MNLYEFGQRLLGTAASVWGARTPRGRHVGLFRGPIRWSRHAFPRSLNEWDSGLVGWCPGCLQSRGFVDKGGGRTGRRGASELAGENRGELLW